jgi:integrase
MTEVSALSPPAVPNATPTDRASALPAGAPAPAPATTTAASPLARAPGTTVAVPVVLGARAGAGLDGATPGEVARTGGLGELDEALAVRVTDYARAARADSTWRAYDADLRHFRDWCARQPSTPVTLPAAPATVAGYLAALADAPYKPTTIRRRLAAISVAHQLAKVPNPATAPEVATVWDGIRRTLGVRPNRKTALETSLLTRVLPAPREPAPPPATATPSTPPADDTSVPAPATNADEYVPAASPRPAGTGSPAAPAPAAGPSPSDVRAAAAARLADIRDRALLLVGFAGCLRRSELVGLDVTDVTTTADGLVLAIRTSKTDQESAGALVGIAYGSYRPTCPVRAWQDWLTAAGLVAGPAFRAVNRHGTVSGGRLDPGSVARIVQRRVAAAGLDPADFAGHSLRSGFATAAARAGVADRAIMRQGRWRSAASLDSYVRAGRLFDRDNPSGHVGL